jgi:hypothetical protein
VYEFIEGVGSFESGLDYFSERRSIRPRRREIRNAHGGLGKNLLGRNGLRRFLFFKDLVLTSHDSVEITFGHKKTNCPVVPIREERGVSSD